MGEKLVFCLRGELVSSWLGTLFVLRLQLPKKEEKVSSERTKKNLSSGREREREREEKRVQPTVVGAADCIS